MRNCDDGAFQMNMPRSKPQAEAGRSCPPRRITLRFDRQFDVDRLLFLAQSAAQFRKRDVLQLANALASDAEFFADFLERLRLATVEPEALENDFFLAIVEHVEQTTDLIAKVLVAQKLKRSLRIFVADDFAKLSRIVIADRRVKRRRANRHRLKLRNFSGGDADLFAKLIIARLAAEFLAHLE